MKVVCIKEFNNLCVTGQPPHGKKPKVGEIYTVTDMYESCFESGLICYQLKELHPLDGWNVERFRPVDNTFGEWVEETIMKEVELETILQ